MLALSGFRLALLGVMTEPALLNRRSEGDEVAWIQRYFRAKEAITGYVVACEYHHRRGSLLQSMTGVDAYNTTSSFSRTFLDFRCPVVLAVSSPVPSQLPSVLFFFAGGGCVETSGAASASMSWSAWLLSVSSGHSSERTCLTTSSSFSPSSWFRYVAYDRE